MTLKHKNLAFLFRASTLHHTSFRFTSGRTSLGPAHWAWSGHTHKKAKASPTTFDFSASEKSNQSNFSALFWKRKANSAMPIIRSHQRLYFLAVSVFSQSSATLVHDSAL